MESKRLSRDELRRERKKMIENEIHESRARLCSRRCFIAWFHRLKRRDRETHGSGTGRRVQHSRFRGGLDLRGGQSYRRTSNEHLFVLSSRPTICTSLEAARQDRLLSAANLALLLLWRAHEPSSRSTLEIPREKLLPPSSNLPFNPSIFQISILERR